MSMNAGFQVTLDLDGRQCLVIGGDEEAVEKTTRLLDAGAKVTVVHPTLHGDLRKLTASGIIIHRGRTFRSTDAQGAVLILNVVKDDLALAKSPLRADEIISSILAGTMLLATDITPVPPSAVIRNARLSSPDITSKESGLDLIRSIT